MPSPYKEIPITFEKGLVQEIEESLLDIGQAAELVNWEPSANGALRSRNAWEAITTDGLPSEYNVRGFGSVAVGGSSAVTVGPTVLQVGAWPDGSADPVATKTVTLNSVNIGSVLVAVVSEDSELTPTVTGGWTQRAIAGTAAENYVKFYTKTAASSTEAFTYTIGITRIRSVTVYEIANLDAEDPGTKWGVDTVLSGIAGTDTVSATGTDTDGGLGIVGYLYDGGEPDTADSGTSGWTTPTQDNANTKTGVTFEDLDQLDGTKEQAGAASMVYTTTSWTPPATGILIVMAAIYDEWGTSAGLSSMSVSGNGLTWHDCFDAGELGEEGVTGLGHLYAWADLSLVAPTEGAITVTVGGSGGLVGGTYSFVRGIGADTIAPFVQDRDLTGNPASIAFITALDEGSGVLGQVSTHRVTPSGLDRVPEWTLGASNMEAKLDSFDHDLNPSASFEMYHRTAYASSGHNGANLSFDLTGGVSSSFQWSVTIYEIKGQGNAAKSLHGPLLQDGTAIQEYDFTANKRVTVKMVLWGYVPQASDPTPNQVDFNIVMALADGDTTYRIYQLPRDEITTGTWEQIDAVTDADNSDAWVSFAQGAGQLAWTATSLTAPRSIQLNPILPSNITDMVGLAGRTAVYHKDRLFIGGSNENPTRVFFSDIGLPTDFTTVTDYLDIGGDDGEAVQGLVSVEGLLLAAKTNRCYLISGSGIESFFVNELSGGTAAAGVPAVRTPYGTIVAGDDDIWVIQGGGVDPMSRPLGAGYEIDGNVSVAYAQDSVLICDSATGQVWRVNLVTGAWSIEEVGPDAPASIVFSLNGRLYYGTNGGDTEVGGTRRQSSARTYDETTGGNTFQAATGRVALLGPSVKYTPRWLFLQTRNHDIDFPNVLFVDIESDHGVTTKDVQVLSATQRDRIDIDRMHTGSEWIKITLRTDSSATAGAIDPERLVLGVDVEAPR
jgi:hypothetical protein